MYDFGKYVGIPFTQYSCYQLIHHIYQQELGIEIPTITVDPNHSNKAFFTYLKQIKDSWVSIDLDSLKVFDVIAMAYIPEHPKVVQHFGIYIGDGKILHTLTKVGAHIVPINSPTIGTTIKGAYRWKEKFYQQN
jgi:cell wall-associated NlpC family hydrolase